MLGSCLHAIIFSYSTSKIVDCCLAQSRSHDLRTLSDVRRNVPGSSMLWQCLLDVSQTSFMAKKDLLKLLIKFAFESLKSHNSATPVAITTVKFPNDQRAMAPLIE
jgi:hypothetical protein